MKALDTAIYWIEYIVRYGSDALKSPAMNLYWWQLNLIDVIGFLVICTIIVIIIVTFIVRFVLEMINGESHSSRAKKVD